MSVERIIKSENTGKIVRKRVLKSNVLFEGFDTKKGLAYIHMNRNLTGDLEILEPYFPKRKNNHGTSPTMSSVNSSWDPEDQWTFPETEISKDIEMEIIARVVEIGIRALFENFTYY